MVLRIEDTDQKRRSDSATTGFMRDLDWLGISWDEGPLSGSNGGGESGPYLQSQRLEIYTEVLEGLVANGKAYHAFDTAEELEAMRAEARAQKKEFRYDGASKRLSPEEAAKRVAAGEASVIRFRSPEEAIIIRDAVLGEATVPAGEIDDFVIRKADGYPTYHLAVTVDDALMGVTHVLRAQEHFLNTAKHMMLQEALGYAQPVYAHLSIIQNPDGSKMSKRDKDKVLKAKLRETDVSAVPEGVACSQEEFQRWLGDKKAQLEIDVLERLASHFQIELPEINVSDFHRSGYMPEVLCNFLALNGWNPGNDVEKFDNAFLAEHFDFSRVQKTPAKFDRQKLLAFNLDAIQAMSDDDFVAKAIGHGREFHPEFIEQFDGEQLKTLLLASHQRSKTLADPFSSNQFLLEADEAIAWQVTKAIRKAMFRGEPTGLELLRKIRGPLASLEQFSVSAIAEAIEVFAEANSEGNIGRIAQPLRIAVSGGTVSPPINDTLAILGKDSTIARIDRCLESLGAEAEAEAEIG